MLNVPSITSRGHIDEVLIDRSHLAVHGHFAAQSHIVNTLVFVVYYLYLQRLPLLSNFHAFVVVFSPILVSQSLGNTIYNGIHNGNVNAVTDQVEIQSIWRLSLVL